MKCILSQVETPLIKFLLHRTLGSEFITTLIIMKTIKEILSKYWYKSYISIWYEEVQYLQYNLFFQLRRPIWNHFILKCYIFRQHTYIYQTSSEKKTKKVLTIKWQEITFVSLRLQFPNLEVSQNISDTNVVYSWNNTQKNPFYFYMNAIKGGWF